MEMMKKNMKFRKQKDTENINILPLFLNFGDEKITSLDIYIGNPHKGEQLQYNGVLYDITNVRYHFKEGLNPYKELFLEEVPNPLLPDGLRD